MCTVSWHLDARSELVSPELHIYFNRDEQRSRPAAVAPSIDTYHGQKLLYPTDPQAGGTWIAANESGCVVALLNDYSASTTSPSDNKPSTSRGLLVKQIASEHTISACQSTLMDWLAHFHIPAFTLLRWDTQHQLHHWHWDGSTLTEHDDTQPPLTSSSWQTKRVEAMRCEVFAQLRPDKAPAPERIAAHLAYQQHQFPGDLRSSVCMSRPETKTVSLTHVHLSATAVTMHYHPRPEDTTFSAPITTSMPLKP